MKRIGDFAIFLAVVNAGALSEATEVLGLSVASISKYITRIEREMGVRLLVRSSRGLKLTGEGRDLFESVNRLFSELDHVVARISDSGHRPAGVLKVTLPVGLGRNRIAPLVSDFAANYPELSVELYLGDRKGDAAGDSVDVAIVLGEPPDSSLLNKRIMRSPCVVCASPAYLQRHPTPVSCEDLEDHECLILDCPGSSKDQWVFHDESGQRHLVKVTGSLITDNSETVREWALQGHGIALESFWDVREHLEKGRLIQLLPEYRMQDLDFYMVYAGGEMIPAKTRAFVSFIESNLARLDQPT